MRARTPKNTGTLKNIGKFPSLKNKKTVWFESHLERDFIYLLEFDPDVIKYQEQPFKIKYHLNGKPRHYTPDFLVERKNKKQVIEVKPQSKIEKEEFIEFQNEMNKFFAKDDYEYLVKTDLTIRLQPRLSNLKFLWRYARIPITVKHQILLIEMFNRKSKFSLSEILDFFVQANEPKEIVYSLLFHGYLLTDINQPITPDSPISIGNIN